MYIGRMGASVLGHAIQLDEVQTQCAIPTQQLRRHGRGPPCGHTALVQTQGGQYLFLNHPIEQRNFEQKRQLLGWHLGVYTFPKLEPQPGYRKEECGACPLHVLSKCLLRLRKKDMHARGQQHVFNQTPFGNVRQRQIRQHPVVFVQWNTFKPLCNDRLERAKTVHHAFGISSGPRGVHHCAQVLSGANDLALKGALQPNDL
jgi:hypothetical protein